ncbi:phosphatase PAP2 family protein [Taibaiella soli]|uniref:Phosphatidic acid phosphatase type 2/haloperoxidase domain-containing protein n=1 Tax=Taibaiella soli TaxID=1649169 RepID=A0A2W2BD94_9BACT|nr:phosphatase PAP2 family protein [Taibaiella soli]PZF71626.1 hypothetical protein DN068_16260 [Taibaiella soli]
MSLPEYDLHILNSINHNRIKSLDLVFIGITDSAYLVALMIPLLLLLYALFKSKPLLKKKALQMLASLAFNTLVITLLKYTINRQRPFELDSTIEKLTGGGSPSFPSGHTSDAFLIATCMVLLFGGQRWSLVLVWIWAVAVAYSRIVLGVHFPSDVIAAMLIGALNALAVHFFLLKKRTKQQTNVGTI